jgi:hypothetical protein
MYEVDLDAAGPETYNFPSNASEEDAAVGSSHEIETISSEILKEDVFHSSTPEMEGSTSEPFEEYHELSSDLDIEFLDSKSNTFIKPNPILDKHDAEHLAELGLLLPAEGGWCRISFEIMHSTRYARRKDSSRSIKSFPDWIQLPNEVKLVVIEHCPDRDLMNLGA